MGSEVEMLEWSRVAGCGGFRSLKEVVLVMKGSEGSSGWEGWWRRVVVVGVGSSLEEGCC